MSTELQIFYAIGILSTLILVAQLILMLFGLDHDATVGDVDMEGPTDHPGGLHILSVRTVVAFFVGFGWTGVIAIENKLPLYGTVILAALVGSVFLFFVFSVMRSLHRLRDSGTLNYRNAVGKVGSVYLPIPANRAGPGQIEILVQGRLTVVQAFTNAGQRIENQAKVRVVDLVDPQTLLVEPLG
ncbi:MAG: hypothetical protein A3G34_11140 [Candidatus Lindowbacteria bacterium RIFCSPLOWO2_12_FULL_62_27]|nr:MAG: hypothetical protein A3G34_11140 [Candidatus Lindowbacteria bacterium RIFCSPLOWO2_12_FULL_62_27]OGH63451.1 MAG: hypothetical protein A3I06_06700 [Candidatus Lindowbacteria bacterium RIFCSPLOWO2_02_FULL_62_12]